MSHTPEGIRKELGERLGLLRGRQTQEELARQLGIHPNTLRNYERGERDPDAILLVTISEVCDASLDWLLGGRGPQSRKDQQRLFDHMEGILNSRTPDEFDDQFLLVPRYSFQSLPAQRQHGSPDPKHQVAFRKSWVVGEMKLDPSRLLATTVAGDGMAPTLNQDDLVLLTTDIGDREDGLYALRFEGRLYLKRLQTLPKDQIRVKSDNPLYEDFTLTTEEVGELEFLARVVWVGHRI